MGTKAKKMKQVQQKREKVESEQDESEMEDNADLSDGADGNDTGRILEEGMSDDDDDMDPAAHGKLLAAIQSLDSKKKQKEKGIIRGIPLAPNNLDLVVHAKKDTSKVKAADIKLKGKPKAAELKKPLSSGELELAKRKIAREDMVEETSKWDPIVRENRLAPQIKYTNQEHGIALYQTLKPKQFVPKTPLEMELYAALGKSQDIMQPDRELTEAEEKALKSMSIKEARARRAELMKHHELLNRMELKAKRLKKIKSKKYRKILRREKEANDKKELEQLRQTDPEAFLERIETLEKGRMEERLTLKHRGGGKFSRLHKAYSKFDDKTRTSIQEMLQKSKELTKKREDSSSDEEDMEETVNLVDEDVEIGPSSTQTETRAEQMKSISKKAGGWLDGPTKFVYVKDDSESKEKNLQNDDCDVAVEMEDNEIKKTKTKKGKKGKKRKISETDNLESDQNTSKRESTENDITNASVSNEEPMKKKRTKKKKNNAMENKSDNTSELELTENDITNVPASNEEPKKKKRKKKKNNAENNKSDNTSKPELSPATENNATTAESKTKKKKKKKKKDATQNAEEPEPIKPAIQTTLITIDEDKGDDDDDDEEGDGNMKVSMEELFEDEDFMEEFARDKAELEEKSRPKVEDLKLPGWGSWAGPDYKEAQKKQAMKKKKKEVQKPVKKPTVSPFVWLNPNRDEHMRKLQPKKVPFPYTSVQQYEASLRQPVSRGLVPETATKLLTKPEVVTKQGHIIKAMDKDDYFSKSTGIAVDEDDKNFGGDVKARSRNVRSNVKSNVKSRKPQKENTNKRRSLR